MFEFLPPADVLLRIGLILGIGLPLLFFLRGWLRKIFEERFSQHYGMLVSKMVFYTGFILLGVSALHEAGFSLGPLLGAAGILGIALGFASQTSVSNVISGFFLMGEKSFEIGDILNVNETVGVVYSVDTLSVKLRAFDNRFIRIPNETMLKSMVINITRFPIRRAEMKISVAYKEDLERVKTVIEDLVEKHPLALQEPGMLLVFEGFNTSSIDFMLNVWCMKEDFLKMRTELYMQIKKRFDEEGIEIPYPHLSLYTGEKSKPFPVRHQSDMESPQN